MNFHFGGLSVLWSWRASDTRCRQRGGRRYGSAGGACSNISCGVAYIFSDLCVHREKGEKWKEIMSFRPAALVLGLSIAFIEIGTIFIYKAGWTMNASFIVTNALITLCLILTGAVLYGEKLSRRQALGIVVSFIGICCIVW